MKRLAALSIALVALVPAGAVESAGPPQLLSFSVAHWASGKVLQRGGICLARPDGRKHVRITRFPNDWSGVWSPDGTRLAVTRFLNSSRLSDIVLVDSRGRPRGGTVSGNDTATLFDANPSWSPDGRRIVFSKGYHGDDLWLTDVGRATQPRPFVDDAWTPAWSPDGQWIAFGGLLPGRSGSGLQLIRPDGSDRRVLAPGGSQPAWSPDSKRIVFTDRDRDLSVIEVDGSGLHKFAATPELEWMPAWSPNGRFIAFARGLERRSIVVADAETGTERWVISRKHGLGVSAPSWRPPVKLPHARRGSCI